MTLNPTSIMRMIFPTCHRLLIEKTIPFHGTNSSQTLVIGSGADPYNKIFNASELYVRLDISNQFSAVDVIGDGAALPVKTESFDRIVAIEVMEHIEDQLHFASEIYRVLKPGGSLVLTVPYLYHLHGDPYDYWRPTYWALKSNFSRFDTINVLSVGNRFHVICDLIVTGHFVRYALFPFRVLNHLFALYKGEKDPAKNYAPSAYFLVARKK